MHTSHLNLRRSLGAVLLAAAPAGLLLAEDARLDLSAGLLVNQGSTVDLAGKTTGGYTLEAGVTLEPEALGARIRPYVGMLRIPAASPGPGGSTFTLDSPHFGFDLLYQPWEKVPLSLLTGPAFHIWQVKATGGSAVASMQDQGIKLGWRFGAQYEVTRNWNVTLTYTFTEWRSDPNQGVASDNPSRPAYFTLMGGYRF